MLVHLVELKAADFQVKHNCGVVEAKQRPRVYFVLEPWFNLHAKLLEVLLLAWQQIVRQMNLILLRLLDLHQPEIQITFQLGEVHGCLVVYLPDVEIAD